MKFGFQSGAAEQVAADALAVGVRSGRLTKDPVLKALDKKFGIFAFAKDAEFSGKKNSVCKIAVRATSGKASIRWVILVGLGDDKNVSETDSHRLGTHASRVAKSLAKLAIVPVSGDASHLESLASGAVGGAYQYEMYRSPKNQKKIALKQVVIVAAGNAKSKAAVARGLAIGESTNLARDLVNAPPNEMTPAALANAAKRSATKAGAKVTVRNKKWLESQKMELFLAVNRGSSEQPYLAHMVHKPRGAKKKVVFVGKGLTFDAGGLCLKPAGSMATMKCDMAGAAATIGILCAAARLKLPVEVHGIIGCTENMLGASAYRPGDVFKSREGKTVEIINTDAEGRLVLADCLSYAKELNPDVLVDHATLTGACMVALGPWTSAVYANDDKLRSRYADAAADAGESFWEMPLNEDLREMLKSDVADMKHLGERWGGSITASLFLQEFVGKTSWVHCDIAGPAFTDAPHDRLPKGGTGFGVATAVKFLQSL